MKLAEKLSLINDEALHLYKEGVFWVSYEQDAFRLCAVKQLRPSRKYVKAVNQDVVSVGFPDSVLESVLAHFEVKERKLQSVCVSVKEVMDDQEFARWRAGIEIRATSLQASSLLSSGTDSSSTSSEMSLIYERLRSFRLSAATPMDCMRLVEDSLWIHAERIG